MKNRYTKLIVRGIISSFVAGLAVLGTLMPLTEVSAQTVTSVVVPRGQFEPYVRADAGHLTERVYYDVVTATKVCNLMGYDTGKVASYSNWDSPSNNTAAYWNGSRWIQSEGARNGYMESVHCESVIPAPVPTLNVSCSATPAQTNIGNTVTFNTSVSGGIGSYTYSWSGTDGLFGNGQFASKIYNTSGTKTATVVVTSGTQSKTVSCSTQINQIILPPPPTEPTLVGSCIANYSQIYTGDTVTFSASVSGGTGSYTYNWSGTDNLFGNTSSVNKSYSTTGTKSASVIIGSGSQAITRNCSVVVNQIVTPPPPPAPLTGSCFASNSQVHPGDSVTFSASVSGGTGVYTYSWSGTDGLFSNGPSATIYYSSVGIKNATLLITSGNQSITRNCSTQVSAVVVNPDPTLSGSCIANDAQVNVGDTVIFSASASGGNGFYTYNWSGNDGLFGSAQSVNKSYSSSGTKTATVIITSGSQSIVRNCSVVVNTGTVQPPVNPPAIVGSCIASDTQVNVGDTVTFSVSASGGTGSYSYNWSGTDGLFGNTVSVVKQYSTIGAKTANVTIVSGNQSITRNCFTQVVSQAVNEPALNGACTVNDSQVTVGETVTFSAQPSGGNGTYTYSWTGSDGLFSTSRLASIVYNSIGAKTATVIITSGGQSIVRNCSTQVSQPVVTNPTLSGSCSANFSQATIGDTVIFNTSVAGGDGSYTYAWSGSDGLSGTGQSVNKVYGASGAKTATVVITSAGQSITRNCYTQINQVIQNNPTLSALCSANYSQANVGDTVTFNASVSGGNGSYTYAWSGADSLVGTGQSVTRSYSSTGTKNASVTVTSDGQSTVANCSTNIVQANNNNNNNQNTTLTGSCYAVQSSANVGDSVSFIAQASGGTGTYNYAWSGTDGLTGSGQSVSHVYTTSGTKNASVTISSNGQVISQNCSTQINYQTGGPNYNYPNYDYNTYLNASCSVNITSAYVGDPVTWYVTNATGGNGFYTYSWSGTDGLYGSGNSAYMTYQTPGTKIATVTLYSNGQSVSRTCTFIVNPRYTGGYPGYTYPNYPQYPTNIVYPNTGYPSYPTTVTYPNNNGVTFSADPGTGYVPLSQVPYTGLNNTVKIILLVVGLVLWSFVVTYIFIIKHRKSQA